ALIVIGKVPGAVGVPASVAVPSLLLTNVTPEGRAPVSESAMEAPLGVPVVVTVKLPAVPTLKVALFALVMAGAAFTVSVKACAALGVTPFAAAMVIGNTPCAVGVPASVAVPLLLFTKVTPAGSAPVSVIDIEALVGSPVVVTVNVPAWFRARVALLALVIDGACSTVSVYDWVALGATPLAAVIVIGKLPAAVGVPERVAVPSLLFTKVTPGGSAPVLERTIEAPLGVPVVVTVKVPAAPTVNVALFELVMAGAWFTASVKD